MRSWTGTNFEKLLEQQWGTNAGHKVHFQSYYKNGMLRAALRQSTPGPKPQTSNLEPSFDCAIKLGIKMSACNRKGMRMPGALAREGCPLGAEVALIGN